MCCIRLDSVRRCCCFSQSWRYCCLLSQTHLFLSHSRSFSNAARHFTLCYTLLSPRQPAVLSGYLTLILSLTHFGELRLGLFATKWRTWVVQNLLNYFFFKAHTIIVLLMSINCNLLMKNFCKRAQWVMGEPTTSPLANRQSQIDQYYGAAAGCGLRSHDGQSNDVHWPNDKIDRLLPLLCQAITIFIGRLLAPSVNYNEQ